jgi:hypothetical protein
VATIREEPLRGPVRPSVDTTVTVIVEHGPRPLDLGAKGVDRDAEAPAQGLCRDLTVKGPMVRDVDMRRTFADDAQEKNAALAMLAGAGLGFLAYGVDQIDCGAGGSCGGLPSTRAAEVTLLAAAAIPVFFLAFNAVRVQDRRIVQSMPPESILGPWHPCGASAPVDERAPFPKPLP